MEEIPHYLIEGVRKFSPLLQAFEAGHSIAEVKSAVLVMLEPEFTNPKMLDRYGIDLLTAEAVNIAKLRIAPEAGLLYSECLKLRRSVLRKNQDRCAEVCSWWEEDIGRGLENYWSAARFEVDKTGLPLDEFAYEVFRNVGSLLEATMLPYLRELAHHSHDEAGQCLSKAEIAQLDFGTIVSRLESMRFGSRMLRPPPFSIALNQWRNIAQHFSIAVDGEAIVCSYGKVNRKSHSFSRQALLESLRSLVLIHLAVRTAHTIFHLDHGDALVTHCKGYRRKDSDIQFQFIVGAASQGFEVTALTVGPDLAQATFKDVTAGDSRDRAIHASQFVLELWEATRAKEVSVIYLAKNGLVGLTSRAAGADCALVASGDKDMAYLASVVKFEVPRADEV